MIHKDIKSFKNTIHYRIIYRMKVTALLPDQLIQDVKNISQGKTITNALIIALNEWISIKKIQVLNKKISQKPLRFQKWYTAEFIRKLNRS